MGEAANPEAANPGAAGREAPGPGAAFLEEARQDEAQIRADRRYLHQHPGVGFDVPETVAYVTEALERMGLAPKPCGKAGIVACVGGKRPGRVFLLRADMDALPMDERASVDFPSLFPGKMHACGHDLHAAMLLEAARILKRREDEICGTVKLMFQPGEEVMAGAHDMVEAGVLEDPPVDAAMMMHTMLPTGLPTGTMLVCPTGAATAACDIFDVTLTGKGAHGSMPELGIDPIVAGCAVVGALQELSARELAMADEAVLTIGYFNAGNVNNVIPETARFGGSIRTFDEGVRARLNRRFEEVVHGVAAAYRVEARIDYAGRCPTLKNDAALAECVPRYLKEALGPAGCLTQEELATYPADMRPARTTASEDFAYVSHEVPTLMLSIATGRPQDGYRFAQHHPEVRFDEACLPFGAAAYAQAAFRWLQEHPLG